MEVTIVRDNSAAVLRAVNDAAQTAVRETLEAILSSVTQEMTGSHSGRVYTHGPQPLPHQASAPGEPPANWTGEYLRDTSIGSVTEQGGSIVGEVGTTSPYAPLLEHGTRKMAPRPMWRPIATEQGQQLEKRMTRELKKRL